VIKSGSLNSTQQYYFMEAVVKPQIKVDPQSNLDLKTRIDQILFANKGKPGSLMVILNEVQAKIGFVSIPMQRYIANALQIPTSRVHGVVTFYSFFTTEPRGTHTIKFCMGTACYVGGTPQIIDKAKQLIGAEPGQTTSDGNITLEACRCVGACSQAPVVVIDEEVHGRVKPNLFARLIRGIDTKEEKT
jgi:NADH-quinone oxidoreductase subunit E